MKIIKVSDIAKYLKVDFFGEDFVISKVKSINEIDNFSLSFSKNRSLNNIDTKSLIIVPIDFIYDENSAFSVILTKNPRLAFAKIVGYFFSHNKNKGKKKSSKIGSNSIIDNSVTIGHNCIIGRNVTIGKNTIINNNIIIYDNTIIGENCYIKSGSVIGEDGFGFDFEEDGTPIRIPHLGNVIIGNNVEIGAKNTIARGTLGSTIIENNVKIDDQVHIAHNCIIRENTIITACVEISGSVCIGKNCWIGPNSSIIQKIKIGNNVTIGIGSIVTCDIDHHEKVMSLEGLNLRKLIKLKKRIEYGN